MQLHIGAVSRLKNGPERQLADDYITRAARLGRNCGITAINVSEYPESRAASADMRKSEEAGLLLKGCPAGAAIFVLDEHGKNMPSRRFASHIARLRDTAVSDVAFLIGGPDGHGKAVLDLNATRLSFGAMTWPHRLVRVMLSEQIYRVVTIMVNHPYHRD